MLASTPCIEALQFVVDPSRDICCILVSLLLPIGAAFFALDVPSLFFPSKVQILRRQ